MTRPEATAAPRLTNTRLRIAHLQGVGPEGSRLSAREPGFYPIASSLAASRAHRRRGFTLVEVLIATTLTLILMAVVAQIFGLVGEGIADSRSTLEMNDRLRGAVARLQEDLEGVTVTMVPPRRPEANEGYFEYVEGPIGVVQIDPTNPLTVASSLLNNNPNVAWYPLVPARQDVDNETIWHLDTTVGDFDDVLMFTTQSREHPFRGRYNATGTIESHQAEVAWFVRGRTLYRRVLLITPGVDLIGVADGGFFNNYDVSVRNVGGSNPLVPNTLADLTRREYRFGHRGAFPFDVRQWGQLRLPILRECSFNPTPGTGWEAGETSVSSLRPSGLAPIDMWLMPHPWATQGITWDSPPPIDSTQGRLSDYPGPRIAEDVILTNVIGFDVKAWDPEAPVRSASPAPAGSDPVAVMPGDPGYASATAEIGKGAYVDLNYNRSGFISGIDSHFSGPGHVRSGLNAGLGWTYDTWSTHYEYDGLDTDSAWDTDGIPDEGTNGFDDDGDGIVDDEDELETSPPYPHPLRGIQVKVRVFDPDSRQIREVTLIQDFNAN